jgi:hypothetical protein
MNTSDLFTELLPKHPRVTRAPPNQALLFTNDFTKSFPKLIKIMTIATLGTITPGLSALQYLLDPQIHYDLLGAPITIIVNACNKKGEFNLV